MDNKLWAGAVLLGLAQPVWAGGPFLVFDDTLVLYDLSRGVIKYDTDLGPLGTLDNSSAINLTTSSFQIWQDLPNVAIRYERAGNLESDITANNYFSFVNNRFNSCTENPRTPGYVLFDSGGGITDTVFGSGASNEILGFAGPDCITEANEIIYSGAVINGKFSEDSGLKGVIVHELGHYSGLDHTLLESFASEDEANIPTMYSFLLNSTQESPALDDQAWLGKLYPETSFNTNFGTITGKVFLSDGVTGFQGANVIARKVGGSPQKDAISVLSGYLTDPANPTANLQGFYEIPGLPPGDYTVEVQEINTSRVTSIGLYNFGSDPVPIPNFPTGAVTEFYNSGESSSDSPTQSSPVTIIAGQTKSNINIILNKPTIDVGFSVDPGSRSINAGQAASYTITLFRNGFSGAIDFSASGLPSGATATFSPDPVTGDTTTLTVTTTTSLAVGSYAFQITGTGSGAQLGAASLTLTVNPTPKVVLSATSTSQTINQGQSTAYTINLNRTNFTGSVDLAISGLPTGATASFSPDPTTGNSSVLTVVTSTTTTVGTKTLTISATGSGVTISSITVNLVVNPSPAVGLTVTPSSQTINQGQSTTYTVTLNRTNFTGSVDLALTGLPTGATASFSPDPTTSNSSVVTITAGSTTTLGTKELTINATATGVTISPVKINLTVNALPAVRLAITPTSQTINQGQSASYTVTINRTNFTGSVDLAIGGLPTGVSASFNPDLTTGTTTQLTLTTTNTAALGTVPLTVSATATGLTIPSITAELTVNPAPQVVLQATPSSQRIIQGESTTYTIILERTNFSGAVLLTATGLAAGTTASFSPNSTTGSTATLTVSTSTTTPVGTQALTISSSSPGATILPTTVSLIVDALPKVTLSTLAPFQTAIASQSISFPLTLQRTNFTGPVDLAVSGIPTGATASFTLDPVTGSSSALVITTTDTTATGTFNLQITATTTNGPIVTPLDVSLTVVPFAQIELTTPVADQTLVLGSTGDLEVAIQRTNFTAPLDLAVLGLPPGVTALVTPDPLDPDQVRVSLSASNQARTGSYELVIAPQVSGAIVIPALVTLNIPAPVTLTEFPVSFTNSGLITIQRIRQQATITNTTGLQLQGPLYFNFTDLTPGVTATTGSPLIVLDSSSVLAVDQSKVVLLEFENPTAQVLTYQSLLTGPEGTLIPVPVTSSGQIQVTRIRQQVTIRNSGTVTLNGPFFLAAENLPPGLTLTNQTTTLLDTGAPAVGLAPTSLDPGGAINVVLEFDNPTAGAVSYSPRFVQGGL